MADFEYDLECYPNFFSASFGLGTGRDFFFEISQWKDDSQAFYCFLMGLKTYGHRAVGFNNCDYDYTLLHSFIESGGTLTYQELKQLSDLILESGKNKPFNPMSIPEWNRHIPQIDLYKIHHFDNQAKRTSLKMIEFCMRSHTIKELPYDPNKPLSYEESRNLCAYNVHDKNETHKFRKHSQPLIDFRDELTAEYDKDFTNFNDTKIGKEYFLMKLREAGVKITDEKGKKIQSKRDSVALVDVILPMIKFERPELNEILSFFKSQTIDKKDKAGNLELKGFFKNLHAIVDGFQIDFGVGGIHASIKKSIIREDEENALIDLDVASYYPNVAIKNRFYPEHLTEKFCDIYEFLYKLRQASEKGSAINAIIKLALNGVYGDSNQKFSPFLDPKYLLSITLNGQLLLCMLAEQLIKIPNLKMVQMNTDGLTFTCPRTYLDHMTKITDWWQKITQLELERVDYKAMYIRDVNSYIAEKKDGKIKRIGAYAYELALHNGSTRELAWHKNQSYVVVAKAAEAALVHGIPIEKFITNHENKLDFLLVTKVPKSSELYLRKEVDKGWGIIIEEDVRLQNITRYYFSKDGGKLIKVMRPTENMIENWLTSEHYRHETTGEFQLVKPGKKPKSGKFKKVERETLIPNDREIGINVSCNVTECNDLNDFNPETIDYSHYISEARKLVDPLFLNESPLAHTN